MAKKMMSLLASNSSFHMYRQSRFGVSILTCCLPGLLLNTVGPVAEQSLEVAAALEGPGQQVAFLSLLLLLGLNAQLALR